MSFRTESLAIAQYFADKEDRNLIGRADPISRTKLISEEQD